MNHGVDKYRETNRRLRRFIRTLRTKPGYEASCVISPCVAITTEQLPIMASWMTGSLPARKQIRGLIEALYTLPATPRPTPGSEK